FPKNIKDVLEVMDRVGIKTMGSVQPDGFIWPTSRNEAVETLSFFCAHLLPHFGKYQDAMVRDEHFLFHSRLSFCLNVKLLHPMEVIQAAVDAHVEDDQRISLAATEGFVRQILGWREYMRGLYWSEMPGYALNNELNNHAALPAWFWTGKTKMACMSQCIQQSLDTAYAHHIQRLMVIGNFCLLAGIAPKEVHQWYLGVYIDAIEWVEITNTLGMSQYADGGIVATKPYVSGGNYIHGMSDYCGNCAYAVKEKTGERACPFNSLYWNFIDRHADRWEKNQRMSMMIRSWQKRSPEDRERVLKDAERVLAHLESL
ncbi:MAG: cryptochrome/photolyase family protein, partial [Flavobacteriales bacterium]